MPELLDRLKSALADRYRLERELGAGAMATVYIAEDLKHERRVALKVLKPELAAVLGPDRFLREIEITAQLNHPHILPLLDSGEASGFLYYAMPYAEGESLRERLNREKQLPVEDALPITGCAPQAPSRRIGGSVYSAAIVPKSVAVTPRGRAHGHDPATIAPLAGVQATSAQHCQRVQQNPLQPEQRDPLRNEPRFRA